MKSKLLIVTVMCVTMAFSAAPLRAEASAMDHRHERQGCVSPAAVKLKEDMRRLWSDHVVWTRSYVVSALAGLEDQSVVLERLLRNQQDIGNAIKPYYGEAAGDKLAALLRDHIAIAGKLVGALKSGNQADAEKFNKEWHKNADDIAAFLSSANPNWTDNQLKGLLYTHLQLLSSDVAARLQKDWKADVAAFDKGVDHIIVLADALSEGIIKQFPQRFN
ncbi:hypothetical protein [Paenibacillus sp. Soil522]|uniref:hypothetical protein n=1 Tax=Paenibacillus sp. Soil522 TaxID=1736388 RepID=UPI0006F76626|nr:hypothetical protein [Paenibacillus sp. Soil522]KRE53590.1 glycosyltransferase [Paenibacillus sp. Soil522]